MGKKRRWFSKAGILLFAEETAKRGRVQDHGWVWGFSIPVCRNRGGDFTLGGELLLLSPGACGFRGRQITLEPLLVSGRTWTLFGMPLSQGVGRTLALLPAPMGPCWGHPIAFPGLQVNVLALSICTREAYQSMKERKVDDGHIININR